ncbi:gustatory receptor [Homalodisca vitripennis]|nr:gustatory receptor [Homalodisca vitripennis]
MLQTEFFYFPDLGAQTSRFPVHPTGCTSLATPLSISFQHVKLATCLKSTSRAACKQYSSIVVTKDLANENGFSFWFADETGQTICKFINKDLDPNLRNQLEGFLIRLPHHNARFSALGFFPIHNETLTARALSKQMAGAVTTYLVILIQFQTEPSST